MFMEDVERLAHDDQAMISEDDVELERQSFLRVLRAYLDYQPTALRDIRSKMRQFESLTAEQWALLYVEDDESDHSEKSKDEKARTAKKTMFTHFERLRMATARNMELIAVILEPHRAALAEEARNDTDEISRQKQVKTSPSDIEKVRSTLKQLHRDWAVQGRKERRQCYGPLLEELQRRFPVKNLTVTPTYSHGDSRQQTSQSMRESRPTNETPVHSKDSDEQQETVRRNDIFVAYTNVPETSAVEVSAQEQEDMRRQRGGIRVLTPGAGLGRLSWEVARLGFDSQGNEFSYFMLLASSFILNSPQEVQCYRFYPWIHTLSNAVSQHDQLRPVYVPDVLPSMLPPQPEFSMCAGDFLEVYTEPNSWDCVLTCFFIDTAHNVIEYIKTIANILKPGGCWINLGPLLYHWADMPGEQSIELSLQQIKSVAKNCGLKIETEVACSEATYCANPSSMMQTAYRPHFFVATK